MSLTPPPLTSDVLAEIIVGLLQRLHQLGDAAFLDQRHLVVHVLVDEVAGGTGGVALHLLVLAVEELHQFTDALQAAHLQISITYVQLERETGLAIWSLNSIFQWSLKVLQQEKKV